MYCVDSHGADIEHFRPKATFPDQMYAWTNMLLCCTECGRIKGNAFPLDPKDRPLLVNPSTEDPWDHLDFDPMTGIITARFDLAEGTFSPKGTETVRVLQLDKREALSDGYKKTLKRLKSVLQRHLDNGQLADLPKVLANEDDHGLMGWCFKTQGQRESPFKELREAHPDIWRRCLELVP